MTENANPADEARKNLDNLRFKISTLQDSASLKSTIDEFTDLSSKAENFSNRIEFLRQRKYAYNGLLEKTAEDIANQWKLIAGSIDSQIKFQSATLQSSLRSIEIRLNSQGAIPPFTQVQMMTAEVDTFDDRCSSVQQTIETMYGNIKNEIETFSQQLSDLEYSLDKAEGASFGFLPGETVVKAVKAVWCRNGKEEKSDPKGVLFITDQRMIFEQNEEVVTKKVFFVTTETQKIQKLLFEVPAVSVASVEGSKQGLFKNQDMLHLDFASGFFAREATLHLFDQPAEDWQKLVIQVKNHEIDSIRVFAIDTNAVEKAKAAPAQCPYCGGAITKPVLRGMDSINCDFCGKDIRL